MIDEWEPSRWWRVIYPENGSWQLWCESSNEREVRASLKTVPSLHPVLERQYRLEKSEWRLVDG